MDRPLPSYLLVPYQPLGSYLDEEIEREAHDSGLSITELLIERARRIDRILDDE
jgi:hypothetical protein